MVLAAAEDPVSPTALPLPTCLPTTPPSTLDATGEAELRPAPVVGGLPHLNPMAVRTDNSINSTTIARAPRLLLLSLPSLPLARPQALSQALAIQTTAHRPR